eukprot:scaffold64941_cov77-Cyclotella_meneghiniana.AAC.13
MSFIAKLVNPSFYASQYAALSKSMTAYYSPLIQSGRSCDGSKIQAGRAEQKKALEEYYANHGISAHH